MPAVGERRVGGANHILDISIVGVVDDGTVLRAWKTIHVKTLTLPLWSSHHGDLLW
jgi:hypothetical protein